jgi:DNA-directed RNA polymerase specialized sigma24 family protein
MNGSDDTNPAGLPAEEPTGQAHSGHDNVVSGAEGAEHASGDEDAPTAEEVEQIFLSMPKMTRAIFIARRFQDLSIAEICRQTGLSHKQVMRHLAKAIDHLVRADQRRRR